MTVTESASAYPNEFDRMRGQLDGVSARTRPSTIIIDSILGVGGETTYIVETFRQRDDLGDGKTGKPLDTVFLRMIGPNGGQRFVLPPRVTNAIASQREALGDREKSASAKKAAATRKARGIVPGFLRKKKP